jgi:hypothetical protein
VVVVDSYILHTHHGGEDIGKASSKVAVVGIDAIQRRQHAKWEFTTEPPIVLDAKVLYGSKLAELRGNRAREVVIVKTFI